MINDIPVVSMFFGAFANAILYGVTCIQTFIYYRKVSPNQPLLPKLIVPVLWILDSLQVAFLMHALYWFTIQNWNNPHALRVEPWSLFANVLVSAVCGAIVRSIFAHRVFILSGRNLYLILPLAGLIATIFVLGLLFCIKGFLTKAFILTPSMDRLIIPLAAMSVLGDIYIAATLCYLVHTRRSKLNKHTDSMLKLVMVYTINNGAATSMVSLTCLISFLTIASTGVPFALYFLLSKLYVNCLLAGLNARDHLRNKASQMSINTPVSPIMLSAPLVFAVPMQSISLTDTRASSQLRTPGDGENGPNSIPFDHWTVDIEEGKQKLARPVAVQVEDGSIRSPSPTLSGYHSCDEV